MVVQVNIKIPVGQTFATPMHFLCLGATSDDQAIDMARNALEEEGLTPDQATFKVVKGLKS